MTEGEAQVFGAWVEFFGSMAPWVIGAVLVAVAIDRLMGER